jgi:hypothetical protein
LSVWVGEKCHPEIMIIHLRDQPRFMLEGDTAPAQFIDGERDVRTAKVKAPHGSEVFPRFFEEKPDAGTIEECQVAKAI